MLGDIRNGRGLLAQWLTALALIAAGLQSGIPSGYMLDHDETTGRLSVVFCTGQGPSARWIDLASGEISDHAGSGENGPAGTAQPCAFAMASATGPLPVIEAWQAPRPVHQAGPVPDTQQRAALPVVRARHPARAPPATL